MRWWFIDDGGRLVSMVWGRCFRRFFDAGAEAIFTSSLVKRGFNVYSTTKPLHATVVVDTILEDSVRISSIQDGLHTRVHEQFSIFVQRVAAMSKASKLFQDRRGENRRL